MPESQDIYSQLSPENLQREIEEEERLKLGELATAASSNEVSEATAEIPEDPTTVASQFWGDDLHEAPLPGSMSRSKRVKRFRTK